MSDEAMRLENKDRRRQRLAEVRSRKLKLALTKSTFNAGFGSMVALTHGTAQHLEIMGDIFDQNIENAGNIPDEFTPNHEYAKANEVVRLQNVVVQEEILRMKEAFTNLFVVLFDENDYDEANLVNEEH